MDERILLLFSGGLDSTLLAHLARAFERPLHCLGIDYGQRHILELDKVRIFCMRHSIPYKIVKVSLDVNSKLTGNQESQYENVSEWYVPSRNLMFVSIAASVAEGQGIHTIWMGANYADRLNLFPDCSQEWIVKVNELLEINGSYPIQVEAPLLGMTKRTIEELAAHFNISREEVFSGYGE